MKRNFMISQYTTNKTLKVGSTTRCPSCGTTFIKSSYQQIFCKSKSRTKCKDKYWNTVDEDKRCRKNDYFYNVILSPEKHVDYSNRTSRAISANIDRTSFAEFCRQNGLDGNSNIAKKVN